MVALLAGVTPAQAHAGLMLTGNDDGRGGVSSTCCGPTDPVTEPVPGRLTAVATGGIRQAALTRRPGQSTVEYDHRMPAGTRISRCPAAATAPG